MRTSLLALIVLITGTALAGNWSYWRGPEQNGVSRETGLPETFSLKKGDPNLVFAVPYSGLTSPIVQDGQVYVIGRTGTGPTQQECVQAFDAADGKLKWEHKFNVWHTDIVDDRLGFTNLAGDPETGNVYAHTTSGMFFCYGKDGKIKWQKSLTEEHGRVSGYGGRVTSPIVDEDKVIVGMLNGSWGEHTVGQTRFVAFDKKTGDIIWWASGGHRVKDTYYSSPTVAVINGQRLMLSGGGDGCIHAFKVRTGEKVWSHKFETGGGAVNCSPVVSGNKVWIGHGEENEGSTQGRLICLDAGSVKDGTVKEVWRKDGIKVKFASPVLHEGLLYVCDEAGKMFCFDADKGKLLWEQDYGTSTKGSPVLADGKIYITEVDSRFHILKPSKTGLEHLANVYFRGRAGVKTELHGTPAISNGRIYFTTTTQLVCIGRKDGKAKYDKVKREVQPKEAEKSDKPAHLQIVPADVTINPGEKVELKAITYDANGQKIGEAKVTWEKAGMLPPVFPIGLIAPKPTPGAKAPPPLAGELSDKEGVKTTFTAAKVPNGQFGRVVAKVNGLTAHARVRVAPTLPYTMDFKNVPETRTPPAWVNTMAKFYTLTLPDGTKVLRKRNDNASPLVARANAYIGAPGLKDYTVEADVWGTQVRGAYLPDVGVGASRYTLTIMGNEKVLRLGTWDAQKRVEAHTDFTLKPQTWYRMKINATVVDGKGVVKGKVWERDQKEPEKWTLELEDPEPNTEGAPLIYGFANGTVGPAQPGPEIHYANIKITPNGKK